MKAIALEYSHELIAITLFALGYIIFKHLMNKRSVIELAKPEKKSAAKKELAKPQEELGHQINSLYDYNVLIKDHYSHKPNLNPFLVLQDMQKTGFTPDITTYNTLLHICLEKRNFKMVEKLITEIKDKLSQVVPDIITFNILLKGESLRLSDLLAKGEENIFETLEEVKSLLGMIDEHKLTATEITYNTVIDICVKAGVMSLAIHFFDVMQEVSLIPDSFTYSTLLKGFRLNDFKLQDWSAKNPAIRAVFPELNLLSYQCSITKALEIFALYKEAHKNKVDDVIFNCMIDTCLRMGLSDKALQLFEEMKTSNIPPGTITYGVIFRGFGQLKNCDIPLNLYQQMKDTDVPMNEITFGCLIDACIRANRLDKATAVFEDMKAHEELKCNTIIYTTMIKGYTKKRNLRKAMKILEAMKADENVEPNVVTYNSLLECAVRCNEFDAAKQIFEETVSLCDDSFKPDIITYSTYMKSLCKQRNTRGALSVYNLVKSKGFKVDEVLFNTLLDGLLKAQEYKMALTIYAEMRTHKINPSNVTFSILVKIYTKLGQYTEAF